MRIAQLAPPYLPVPPPLYGGTERIVSLLTEGLVAHGHEVTLFASGDSQTSARLNSFYPKALGNSGITKDSANAAIAHYKACYARANEFDIIHSHGQYLSYPGAVGLKTPTVFTLHGSFYTGETTPEKRATLLAHKTNNFISISNNQREGMPNLNYIKTIYNAINIADYPFVPSSKGDYVLWVGRISPKKGALDAILAAKQVGVRLEIAATIDPIDRPYFESHIKPLIDGKTVVYHGEIKPTALAELYGGALATLFPISWHEPFGLVMTESMACGTPVIAYNSGSVPEIIVDGKTGFIVNSISNMATAITQVKSINRHVCRHHVEAQFSAELMVANYESVYKSLVKNQ